MITARRPESGKGGFFFKRAMSAAEAKLERATNKLDANTRGLRRQATHYGSVKHCCIGAFGNALFLSETYFKSSK